MPQVEIYTQPFCPFCEAALALLRRKGAAVTEYDAPRGSAARAEAIRRSGGRETVPQIFIGGRHIGGCDDLMALERAGELDRLLAE
ncbi:MAG: glutaredoxin 3 [Rhodovarius sp.]|nr:glutaredoxin 3 [Rhodovarius sp.]MCX7933455.1 glutaredoxin 3 [Rhodovarius sp.]MDW8313834.1 glutaredoxin 3 [Rhodovarius sp.]